MAAKVPWMSCSVDWLHGLAARGGEVKGARAWALFLSFSLLGEDRIDVRLFRQPRARETNQRTSTFFAFPEM